jgi:hypothetical protein
MLLCQAGERFLSHLYRGRQVAEGLPAKDGASRQTVGAVHTEDMETKIQKVDEGGMAGEERDSRFEEDVTSDTSEEEPAPLLASGANATRITDATNKQSWLASTAGIVADPAAFGADGNGADPASLGT